MSKLVDDLKREVAEGRVTVIVGAGVSIAATLDPARKPNVASWKGLLESGVDECVKVAQPLPPGWETRVRADIASDDLDDLLSAASKIERKLGGPKAGDFVRWLTDTIGQLRILHCHTPRRICPRDFVCRDRHSGPRTANQQSLLELTF